MPLSNAALDSRTFNSERTDVLATWPTGHDVSFEAGVDLQRSLDRGKVFARVLHEADAAGRTLLQPRAGVALVDDHIRILGRLEPACDLLPTTIDSYTRLNRYDEAANGIQRSRNAGHSLLNGFPAVNHGLDGCRDVVEAMSKPLQIRHGTPDARLLAEITLAAGFTAFEGGGISYNIPYAKRVPLETSIRHWQYVDRLAGMYEEAGAPINREPFGPLSGTLVPPFISHTVGIIEGLLALQQGVKSLTLGYGQAGNLIQDIAAIRSLLTLAHEAFRGAGFDDYELTTVFHQWMGGFPEDEARAFAVIGWGATVASLAGATKVITKTPHEAMGVPTPDANLQGLRATAQVTNMLGGQHLGTSAAISEEADQICTEVRHLLAQVRQLGDGDVAVGTVRAFEAGMLDVPFAPSVFNQGKLLPCRDNQGRIRVLDWGNVPMDDDVMAQHHDALAERARLEGRQPCFQMVIDDIYAISKGRLVGRPK